VKNIQNQQLNISPASCAFIFCLVLFTATALRIYAMALPLDYDEAYTFLRYLDKPFAKIISDYTVANNHVLFSLIGKLSVMSFGPSIWAMRLPSLIFGALGIVSFYILWQRVTNRQSAILATVLMATALPLVFYSGQARGYSLQALLFICTFLAADNLQQQPKASRGLILATLSALCLYTIPTSLYGIGAIYLWLLLLAIFDAPKNQRCNLIVALFLSGLTAVILTLVLYSPILLHYHGFPSIKQANPLELQELFTALPQSLLSVTARWNKTFSLPLLTCIHAGLFIGVIALCHKKTIKPAALIVSLLVSIAAMIVITRIIPPFQRNWIFILPFYLGLVAFGLTTILKVITSRLNRWQPYVFSLLALLILSSGTFHTHTILKNKIERETGNANLLYPIVAEFSKPGDFVACHEFLCDKFRFFWHRDGITLNKIKVGWDCNMVQINRRGYKSSPFQHSEEKVILVTRKDKDKKPFLNWIKKYVPSGYSLTEKIVATSGKSKVIQFTITQPR